MIERIGPDNGAGGKCYCSNHVQKNQAMVIRLEMDYIWIMSLCSKVVLTNGI